MNSVSSFMLESREQAECDRLKRNIQAGKPSRWFLILHSLNIINNLQSSSDVRN